MRSVLLLAMLVGCGAPQPAGDAGVNDAGVEVDGGTDAGVDAGIWPNPTGWTTLSALSQPRFFHTATLLRDGTVLIVGGESAVGVPTASVERFTPSTGALTTLAPLPLPRSHHVAALLPSGEVLLAGGGRSSGNGRTYPGSDVTASTVAYDAVTGTTRALAPMNHARSFAQGAVLQNGEVLVVGGGGGTFLGGNPAIADALASAEIYGLNGSWRDVGSMASSRIFHSVTVLPRGAVLVVGGVNELNSSFATAEWFDPETERFVGAGRMEGDRFRHAATALKDGRLMVVGGKRANVAFLNTVEFYSPETNTWSLGPVVAGGGNGGRLDLLSSGDVLFTGGNVIRSNQLVNSNESSLYELTTGQWRAVGALAVARTFHTSTVLEDGRVLLTGGMSPAGDPLGAVELSLR